MMKVVSNVNRVSSCEGVRCEGAVIVLAGFTRQIPGVSAQSYKEMMWMLSRLDGYFEELI